MERTKIVFLSDVHMGNGASYSWFPESGNGALNYPDCIAGILKKIASDKSVRELVLLGDFFDLWVYPTHMVPWNFKQIVTHWDEKVIQPLRECVANIPNVYYMNGNHDMSISAEQIESIQANGKYVQWTTFEDYSSKYNGILHAEHGNSVDMFNAPVDPSDALNNKPLGYYMARMIADRPSPSSPNYKHGRSAWGDMTEVITQSCQNYTPEKGEEIGSSMVEQLMDLLMGQVNSYGASLSDETEFVFADPSQNVTIGMVKKSYSNILNHWAAKKEGTLSDYALAMFTPGRAGLDWYARKLIEQGKAKIVIMGHVHKAEWKPYTKGSNTGTYINDGCWCIAGPDPEPRYAVIEVQDPHELDMSLLGWGHILEKGREKIVSNNTEGE